MSNTILIIFLIGMGVFFAAVTAAIYTIFHLMKGKTENQKKIFQEMSQKLGFNYIDNPGEYFKNKYSNFSEFSGERNYNMMNLLEGVFNGTKWELFEVRQSETKPGERALVKTTIDFFMVFCCHLEGFTLPKFALGSASKMRERDFFRNLDTIEIQEVKDLKRFFILKGKDKPALQKLFSKDLIGYLKNLKNPLLMEGEGDRVIFFIPSPGPFAESDDFKDTPNKLSEFKEVVEKFRESSQKEAL